MQSLKSAAVLCQAAARCAGAAANVGLNPAAVLCLAVARCAGVARQGGSGLLAARGCILPQHSGGCHQGRLAPGHNQEGQLASVVAMWSTEGHWILTCAGTL